MMIGVRRYVERIRETTRAVQAADDRLEGASTEAEADDLNEVAWVAEEARRRAWFGKD